jgi:predicted kinase
MATPDFIMLVGVPGSGKSTWTRQFLETATKTFAVISTDDVLEGIAASRGISYSEAFKKYFKAAKREALQRFEHAKAAGYSIVWDQTNMASSKRKSVLASVPKDYIKTAMVFIVPEAELNCRLAAREAETGKHIPPFVMRDMFKNYEEPTKAEGFDQVLFV